MKELSTCNIAVSDLEYLIGLHNVYGNKSRDITGITQLVKDRPIDHIMQLIDATDYATLDLYKEEDYIKNAKTYAEDILDCDNVPEALAEVLPIYLEHEETGRAAAKNNYARDRKQGEEGYSQFVDDDIYSEMQRRFGTKTEGTLVIKFPDGTKESVKTNYDPMSQKIDCIEIAKTIELINGIGHVPLSMVSMTLKTNKDETHTVLYEYDITPELIKSMPEKEAGNLYWLASVEHSTIKKDTE